MSDPSAPQRDALERALAGQPEPGVEVVRGERPSLLDGVAVRAVLAPFMAAFMVAAAVFRAQLVTTPLDPLTLLLRALAFAFCVRALVLLALFGRDLWRNTKAPRHRLAWSADALLWAGERADVFVRRQDVLGIDVGQAGRATWGRSDALPLYLTLRPREGRAAYVALPPYFAATTELLRARLSNAWGQPAPAFEQPVGPALSPPETRYAQAARGRLDPGSVCVREGRRWVRRGPYGTLLGAFAALDVARTVGLQQPQVRSAILMAFALCLASPLMWWSWMKVRGRRRRGIAMLLCPEELLVQGTRGTISLPWSQLANVELEARGRWSPFLGSYIAQELYLTTQEGEVMRFDADLLDTPVEVVAALCRAYSATA